jgi:DNA-binding response OmpR family regulator
MKVLIIEDEIFSANHLKLIIEKSGHTVIDIVDNAYSAIEVCKTYKPEIVFMDIMLKGSLNGDTLSYKIYTKYPSIILIFLTAYLDDETLEYASKSHAFSYLMKPYREGEIIATLKLADTQLQSTLQTTQNKQNHIYLIDNYKFDLEKNKLFFNNDEVPLSKNAKKLFSILCKNTHTFVDNEQILYKIWKEQGSNEALRSLVYRIKLSTSPKIILNHNKIGYKIMLKND